MQIKTAMSYHLIPVRMIIIKKTRHNNTQLPALDVGLLLPASAPDLGHGVAPLCRALCTIAAARALCAMLYDIKLYNYKFSGA